MGVKCPLCENSFPGIRFENNCEICLLWHLMVAQNENPTLDGFKEIVADADKSP